MKKKKRKKNSKIQKLLNLFYGIYWKTINILEKEII